jgi:hypothetical protein
MWLVNQLVGLIVNAVTLNYAAHAAALARLGHNDNQARDA